VTKHAGGDTSVAVRTQLPLLGPSCTEDNRCMHTSAKEQQDIEDRNRNDVFRRPITNPEAPKLGPDFRDRAFPTA
jgi:hypothetical protein